MEEREGVEGLPAGKAKRKGSQSACGRRWELQILLLVFSWREMLKGRRVLCLIGAGGGLPRPRSSTRPPPLCPEP